MACIQKRGNSYRIKVSCGYDIRGNQIFQSTTYKPEKNLTERQARKEAEKRAFEFEDECLRGKVVSTKKFEEVAEEWFEQYAKINQRPTTYYRNLQLRKRIYNAIGHMRMDKINTAIVQRFINSLMTEEKNEKTGKALARKTVTHYLSLISCVFTYAIRIGNFTYNPCSNVVIPKQEAKEIEIYQKSEVVKLFELLEEAPLKWKVYIKVSIYTGFRKGEMLGLEWKDINFENSTIKVSRAENYTPLAGQYTDNPKTRKGKRTLCQPKRVMDMLKELYDSQQKEKEKKGDRWKDTDRVFINEEGEPLNTREPYNWFKEFCEKHEFTFHTLHSLRHLHASLMIEQGVSDVDLSGDLGHAQVSTTKNIYCHMFEEAKQRNSNAIDNALRFDKNEKVC